jgi:hypothetical protein
MWSTILLLVLMVLSFGYPMPWRQASTSFLQSNQTLQGNLTDLSQLNFAPFEVAELHIVCHRLDPTANYTCLLFCKQQDLVRNGRAKH